MAVSKDLFLFVFAFTSRNSFGAGRASDRGLRPEGPLEAAPQPRMPAQIQHTFSLPASGRLRLHRRQHRGPRGRGIPNGVGDEQAVFLPLPSHEGQLRHGDDLPGERHRDAPRVRDLRYGRRRRVGVCVGRGGEEATGVFSQVGV